MSSKTRYRYRETGLEYTAPKVSQNKGAASTNVRIPHAIERLARVFDSVCLAIKSTAPSVTAIEASAAPSAMQSIVTISTRGTPAQVPSLSAT